MFKFIRRIFASLAKEAANQIPNQVPFVRTPAFQDVVEDHLDRCFGKRIERRNIHIAELASDQFDRDLASIQNARIPRRIETNTDMLR
jgi:hypothetical protein